jgi:hypothetical protein
MTPASQTGVESPSSFHAPSLDETQQRIVDSLRREGFAVAQFRELFDDATWSELADDIVPFVRQTEEAVRNAGDRPAKKADFIVRRFLRKGEGAPTPVFSFDDPWLRVGASERMLDVINSYRGQLTKLHYIDNWYTVPFSAADERIASQRWHRDPEEEHIVKVFLYFSEVDEDAGPFEYVRGSFSGGPYGDFWPWRKGKDERHPPEDELYRVIPPEDRLTLTGKPGTMIFCDTGGFHRGGFARTKPRILATWSYISPAVGKRPKYEVRFEGRESDLPAQVSATLP